MKRIYLAATLAAAFTLPAQAQEVRKFDGPWIGATVGYDRMASRRDASAMSGVTYGGAAGYDFRLGKLIAGIEFERNGKSIKASAHDVEVAGDQLDLSVGRDRYIGVRAGFPVSDQLLLYAKGGYTKLHSHSRYVTGDEITKDTSDHGGWRIGAGANEGAVYVLAKPRFAGKRHSFSFRGIAWMAWLQRTAGSPTVVKDVNGRCAGLSPGHQEARDVGFGGRIVARAPARVIESVLDVDEQQRGAGIGTEHLSQLLAETGSFNAGEDRMVRATL